MNSELCRSRLLERAMRTVAITVSDDVAERLQHHADRLDEVLRLGLQQLQIGEVLLLYQRELISLARAAELAGLSRDEMVRQARAAGVEPLWSEEMAQEELS